MNCNVFLSGSADVPAVVTEGDLEICGSGFYLTYTLGGDNCALSAKRGVVTQSRRGGVNTDITFVRGKNSVCMLLSGELTGSVPVYTSALEIKTGERGAELFIDYRLGGAHINLNLSATYKEIK